MTRYINAGFNNLVAADRVVAVLTSGSMPCRRLVQHKRDVEKLLDATAGKRHKSVLVLDNDYIVLTSLSTSSIHNRLMMASKNEIAEDKSDS